MIFMVIGPYGKMAKIVNLSLINISATMPDGEMKENRRPSVDWITLRVHSVGKNLALIFFIVTTSILVSK